MPSFSLAPVFQNHAVLQRDIPLPIWGWAEPDSLVQVELAGNLAQVTTASDGRWCLRMPPLPAGGPHELRATNQSGEQNREIFLQDLLLGDVWLCSGQSNAEWQLHQVDPENLQSQGVHLPHLRLLTVSTPVQPGPQIAIDGKWEEASEKNLPRFSAIGGWFGRRLQESLQVPVGVICNAWGGTRIQAWTSREALMTDPEGQREIREFEAEVYLPPSADRPQSYSSLDEWAATDGPQGEENKGLAQGWASENFDASAWPTMRLPCIWQHEGGPKHGVVWFRLSLEIPAEWSGRDLMLHLGTVDKHDDTYVNGHFVGRTSWETANSWCKVREYAVPAHCVGPDRRVTIAVRARSSIYDGGLRGPAESMRLLPADAPNNEGVCLAGAWHWQVEQDWSEIPQPTNFFTSTRSQNAPAALFQSRLHPLIPYGLRGVIWYQGENNVPEASLYRRLLPLMIQDWWRAWGQGPFPFIQVQLASYLPPSSTPGESAWAELRDAQAAGIALSQVGFIPAIDIGDAADVHPRNKKDVGLRLARWALAEVYAQGGLPTGPLYAGCRSEAGNCLRIFFRHAQGLTTRDGDPVRHVAIRSAQSPWQWAHSRIEGESLLVWHPDIAAPTAARYAWADNPEHCNLVNAADLPAAPFDTRTTIPA